MALEMDNGGDEEVDGTGDLDLYIVQLLRNASFEYVIYGDAEAGVLKDGAGGVEKGGVHIEKQALFIEASRLNLLHSHPLQDLFEFSPIVFPDEDIYVEHPPFSHCGVDISEKADPPEKEDLRPVFLQAGE